eukprot:gene17932-biopygen11428
MIAGDYQNLHSKGTEKQCRCLWQNKKFFADKPDESTLSPEMKEHYRPLAKISVGKISAAEYSRNSI